MTTAIGQPDTMNHILCGTPVKMRGYLRTSYRVFHGGERGIVRCEQDNGLGQRVLQVEWLDTEKIGAVFFGDVEVVV